MKDTTSLNILLADDDKDDCFFFKAVLAELPIATSLTTVNDGEQLMQHVQNAANIPHALFLDLNMPRKNGFECLVEIKKHSLLKKIPVLIFSTSYDEEKANQLYTNGAHYYICKPADFSELKKVIERALQLILKAKTEQPPKEKFLLSNLKSILI